MQVAKNTMVTSIEEFIDVIGKIRPTTESITVNGNISDENIHLNISWIEEETL